MVYEVNGVEYNVTGEFYYNAKKGRYEHIHIGKKGLDNEISRSS